MHSVRESDGRRPKLVKISLFSTREIYVGALIEQMEKLGLAWSLYSFPSHYIISSVPWSSVDLATKEKNAHDSVSSKREQVRGVIRT